MLSSSVLSLPHWFLDFGFPQPMIRKGFPSGSSRLSVRSSSGRWCLPPFLHGAPEPRVDWGSAVVDVVMLYWDETNGMQETVTALLQLQPSPPPRINQSILQRPVRPKPRPKISGQQSHRPLSHSTAGSPHFFLSPRGFCFSGLAFPFGRQSGSRSPGTGLVSSDLTLFEHLAQPHCSRLSAIFPVDSLVSSVPTTPGPDSDSSHPVSPQEFFFSSDVRPSRVSCDIFSPYFFFDVLGRKVCFFHILPLFPQHQLPPVALALAHRYLPTLDPVPLEPPDTNLAPHRFPRLLSHTF